MRSPNGRHRGPVDRSAFPSGKRQYLTAVQKRILRAFAENGGKAIIATGARYTRGEPGKLFLVTHAFNLVREREWVAIDREANAASKIGVGNWLLTPAGRLAYQRGWYIRELGDV